MLTAPSPGRLAAGLAHHCSAHQFFSFVVLGSGQGQEELLHGLDVHVSSTGIVQALP
jgi:hypothetical protein